MTRTQVILAAAMLLCYAIGYPVALIGRSAFGWLLVSLGGVFLIALGIVTIPRIHRSITDSEAPEHQP